MCRNPSSGLFDYTNKKRVDAHDYGHEKNARCIARKDDLLMKVHSAQVNTPIMLECFHMRTFFEKNQKSKKMEEKNENKQISSS
jgi:adenosyl cobinamide kinase/adenosyl cobinamide phosphate guanylyltransferase